MDTELIRRMRDRLLANGRPSLFPPPLTGAEGLGALDPYEHASLERLTPMVELLYLMMHADGQPADRERDAIRGMVRTLTDGLLRGTTADWLFERCAAELAREGLDARLDHTTDLLAADRDDAEVALLLAAAVALADDHVQPTEHRLFERVARGLGLSAARVSTLLGPG